jgi:hypothetical protein
LEAEFTKTLKTGANSQKTQWNRQFPGRSPTEKEPWKWRSKTGAKLGRKTTPKTMGQSSLHPPQNGSKAGLQMAKRRTIEIPNCWVMKLGNPKHDKYGTRKLAKGGTMLHFKVLVFHVFQF